MAYKITVKKRFTNKVKNLLLYLEKTWNEDVAADFMLKLDKQIERVHLRPHTGIQIKSFKSTRSVLITKHNRMFYRIKRDTVEILNMYDTRMNPGNNPYKFK
jgi:plasmid stabilization system protein ParE